MAKIYIFVNLTSQCSHMIIASVASETFYEKEVAGWVGVRLKREGITCI